MQDPAFAYAWPRRPGPRLGPRCTSASPDPQPLKCRQGACSPGATAFSKAPARSMLDDLAADPSGRRLGRRVSGRTRWPMGARSSRAVRRSARAGAIWRRALPSSGRRRSGEARDRSGDGSLRSTRGSPSRRSWFAVSGLCGSPIPGTMMGVCAAQRGQSVGYEQVQSGGAPHRSGAGRRRARGCSRALRDGRIGASVRPGRAA